MTSTVSVPVWLVLVLIALTAWAALDRLLIPSVRWFLHRRANRVIQEINKHLNLELRPFHLTQRRVLIDRLVFDSLVVEAANAHAAENDMPRELVMEEVRRYAREIVPAFNAYVYFRAGYWVAKRIASVMYRVRIGYMDERGLSGVDPRASVVFVINHRSNMDYVLVSYLAADRTAMSYAVGEWARVWPLQTLIKWMGGYFVRRRSRNPLYRRVLARYVQMATESGVVQAVFPEGGLTKDGALMPPRLGILDYMLRGFDVNAERDVVFIPVGINFDRVLEDRTQLRHVQDGREPAPRGPVATTFRFLGHQLGLALRGRWHRLGYACVNFGSPISMRDYVRERDIDFRAMEKAPRFEEIGRLADVLMTEVGRMIPVVPVALVATVFSDHPEHALSMLELKARCHTLLGDLLDSGARVYVPRSDHDYAIEVGLRMLTLRHFVGEEGGLYRANPAELTALRYYANSIAHLRL